MTPPPFGATCLLLLTFPLLAGCASEGAAFPQQSSNALGPPSAATTSVATASQSTDPLSTVRGAVTDPEFVPIPNASVSFPQYRIAVRTGPDGQFQFDGVPHGSWIMDVYAVGYEAMARLVDVNDPIVEVRLVLARLAPEEIPYVLVIPQTYYLNLSYMVPHQAQGTVDNLNLPDTCGKCRAQLRFDPRPMSWIIESTWQAGVGTANQIVVSYAYQNMSSGKGTGWSRGGWSMGNADKHDLGDLSSLRSRNATMAHLNVSASYLQFSFQHRVTLWVTFGYVEALGPDYSAVPRS